MTIFIPTTSEDASSDVLIYLLKDKGINTFRWNIDLWSHYQITINEQQKQIIDPLGTILNLKSNDTVLFWRKPHIDTIETHINREPLNESNYNYLKNEFKAFLIYLSNLLKNKTIIIEPYADRRLTKLIQIESAKKYFHIPEYEFSTHDFNILDPIIVKPIGNALVGEKIFYTTNVEKHKLYKPFPWYSQNALIGGSDITAVYIEGEITFYECKFKRDMEHVDWRVEINSSQQSTWQMIEQPRKIYGSVKKLMNEFNLIFGRLDFIKLNNKLYFLECNPNGQFGWLDNDELTLHNKLADCVAKNYLSKSFINGSVY